MGSECGRDESCCRALVLVALGLPAVAAPDEELLGKAAGYPIGTRANWFFDESVRVGSFSHLDSILPHYTLKKAAAPLPLPRNSAAPKIEYQFEKRTLTLDDFLDRQRVTGLLLIKDGKVLVERYQYDRKPDNRFVSHSMAKSIVSIAVGMALAEKKIASLDDTVAKYVSETGRQSLWRDHDPQHSADGVRRAVQEVYDGNDDLAEFCADPAHARTRSPRCACSRRARRSRGRAFTTPPARPWLLTVLLRAVTGTTSANI